MGIIKNAEANGMVADKIRKSSIPALPKELEKEIDKIHTDGNKLQVVTTILKEINKEEEDSSKKFTLYRHDYKPKGKRGRFVKMYVKETAELIRQSKSLSDLKVLTTMIEFMNFDTKEIFIPNTKLATILEMKPQAVGRSIKSLLEQGFILIQEGCENNKIKTYILNEKYFQYGE